MCKCQIITCESNRRRKNGIWRTSQENSEENEEGKCDKSNPAHPRILSDCNRLFEKLDDKMQDHFVECASRRHIRKKQRRF